MTASRQLTWARWQPITRPPRKLWVQCFACRTSTLNEDRHLRGWQQSIAIPRVYVCPTCAEAAA